MSRCMTRLLLPFTLIAALSACSAGTAPDDDATEQEQALTAAQQAAESAAAPPAPPAIDTASPEPECDASQVQGLVGQALDDAKAEQARTDASAKSVRVLEPGAVVTMEFDSKRLNIEVDAAGKITAVRCG